MSTKEQAIAEQLAGAINIKKIWGNFIVNVKDYGAIGDGVTDDTAAFQRAVDYVNGLSKHDIYIPPGTYKFTTLNNTAEIMFYGDGVTLSGSTVLNVTSYHKMIERITNIVASAGDSNTEIVDSRLPNSGSAYPTLKDRLDTEHAELGIRITNEESARSTADTAHANSTSAHDAENITFVPGESGLTSSKAGGAIREAYAKVGQEVSRVENESKARDAAQDARINNLASNAGNSNTEIVDARHDVVSGTTYGTLSARLNNVSSQLAEKAQQADVDLKADKTYVDASLNDIGIAQINKNKGLLDQTYMSQEFLQQMAGTTPINSVPADDSTTTQKIANLAVTIEKTDFLKVASTNLFNKDTASVNTLVSTSNGTLTANASYTTSDFIPVTPNTEYNSWWAGRRAYYRKDKSFISGNADTVQTFTTPADAYYVRLSFSNSSISDGSARLNLGSVLLDHEPYRLSVSGLGVDGSLIQNLKIKSQQTNFVEVVSNNILNADDYLTDTTFSNSNGTLSTSVGNKTSKYVDVEPNTVYSQDKTIKVAFYDKNELFLGFVGADATFTTPARTAYMRVVFTDKYAQINKGSTLLAYDKYAVKVKGVTVKNPDTLSALETLEAFKAVDKFIIDGSLEGTYTAPILPANSGIDTMKSNNIFAFYDALVAAYPSYVTKTTLGQNSLGTNIYRYDFKAAPIETVAETVKKPKMILISGIHPEKAGVYTLYQSMKQICEGWKTDESLETLRWSVEFIVIPIVSPYAFDNNSRKNENGVDIARNFPTDWRVSNVTDADYGGTAPLTELEAQLVNQVMQQNQDAISFISFHNFYGQTTNNDFIWCAAATQLVKNIGKRLVSKLSRKWKKEYNWLPQSETTYFGYSNYGAPIGSEGRHAASYGIQGGTFEICETFYWETTPARFSSMVLTLGLETFINYLILTLKTNVEYYNNK